MLALAVARAALAAADGGAADVLSTDTLLPTGVSPPCRLRPPALPNQPVTKACTRFRSHPLDPRSQLNADRFPLKVTAMLYFDATTSEPASVIIAAATVLVAVWVRGWDHVGVSRPGT